MSKNPLAEATIKVAFFRVDNRILVGSRYGLTLHAERPELLSEQDQTQISEILANLLESLLPHLKD